jgi:hypothetical protein
MSSKVTIRRNASGAGFPIYLRVKYVDTFHFRDPYASDPTHSYLSKDHFVSQILCLFLRPLKRRALL